MASASEKRRSVSPIPVERIERSILLIRGQEVMLDDTLAELYGVTTKRLNEQVKRNKTRFPEDFMFRLSKEEWDCLRSQFATSKTGALVRQVKRYIDRFPEDLMLQLTKQKWSALKCHLGISKPGRAGRRYAP